MNIKDNVTNNQFCGNGCGWNEIFSSTCRDKIVISAVMEEKLEERGMEIKSVGTCEDKTSAGQNGKVLG